jgi:hypothetical protein
MRGHIVAKPIDIAKAKEGSMVVYWSHMNMWKVVRLPRKNDKMWKFKELVRAKPQELFIRTIVAGFHVDFPVVTTQWETIAENGWIDHTKKEFGFRIINRPGDPSNLNLAVIEPEKKGKGTIKAGDKVTFADDWGKQDIEGHQLTLIRKGSPGTVIVVSDDGQSYCIETKIGKFSWVEKKFVVPNRLHKFMRSIVDVF